MKTINSNSNCEQNKLYSRLTKLGLLYLRKHAKLNIRIKTRNLSKKCKEDVLNNYTATICYIIEESIRMLKMLLRKTCDTQTNNEAEGGN